MSEAAKQRAKPAETARRVPRQSRSKARVERILDAAEHDFANFGYAGATTEAIAERAGTSIGSLYQFFPNKRALFDAIAERFLGDVRDFFDAFVEMSAGVSSWESLIELAVGGFWEFSSSSRGFRAVWVHGNLSHELIEASERVNRELAQRVTTLLARFTPDLDAVKRELVATIAVETVSTMVYVATKRGGATSELLAEETTVLLKAYLGKYIEGGRI